MPVKVYFKGTKFEIQYMRIRKFDGNILFLIIQKLNTTCMIKKTLQFIRKKTTSKRENIYSIPVEDKF